MAVGAGVCGEVWGVGGGGGGGGGRGVSTGALRGAPGL